MSNYKLEQNKFKELAKSKFYRKGTEVPDTVDDNGAVHKFPNGYPVPKNNYEVRSKPTKPPKIGTNHERMLERQAVRLQKSSNGSGEPQSSQKASQS